MTAHGGAAPITIIDDHALFAESLALTFETEGYPVRRIDLARPGTTLATVLATTLRSASRVIILDLDLGGLGEGDRLIAPLAAAGARVVVITGANDQARWGRCLDAGAKHVMLKSRPLHEVVAVVRRARDGLPLMPPEERRALIELARRDHSETRDIRLRLDRLTHREMEILGMLMDGCQVREIARIGVVSEATVRTQVKAILAKLETNTQLAAVGAAFKAGWRPPSD